MHILCIAIKCNFTQSNISMSHEEFTNAQGYIQQSLYALQSPARVFRPVPRQRAKQVTVSTHTSILPKNIDADMCIQIDSKSQHKLASTCRLEPFIIFVVFILLLEATLCLISQYLPTFLQLEKLIADSLIDEAISRIWSFSCGLFLGEEACESLSICEVFFGTKLCGEGGLCYTVMGNSGCLRMF